MLLDVFLMLGDACNFEAYKKCRRAADRGGKQQIKEIFPYIAMMAVCLVLHSYFKTLAVAQLDSAQLYPLSQGASFMLSTLMATIFFGKKLTAKCVIGVVLVFLSFLGINLF